MVAYKSDVTRSARRPSLQLADSFLSSYHHHRLTALCLAAQFLYNILSELWLITISLSSSTVRICDSVL